MILLDRILSVKRIFKPGLIVLVSVFLGCETADDVGVSFPLETNIGVEFVEFTLPASNIYIDSLRTDQSNFVSVGNYTDPFSGSVRAEGYFSFSYISGTIPDNAIEKNYVFDSVRLALASTGSIEGSGLFNQSIVYGQLVDTLNASFTYLSSTKRDTFSQIGTATFEVVPKDTIVSNSLLSESFGLDLFETLKESSSFSLADFPSLSIASTSQSQTMSNALLDNDSSRLYLYIRHPDAIEEIEGTDTTYRDTVYQAEFAFAGKNYTHLIRNHSSSEFSGIVENSDFDLADGRTVIDPLLGLSTAFSIESLENFFDDSDDIIFNRISLLFEMENSSGRDTLMTFASYFRKADKSFFGPAISSGQTRFLNTITTDDTFLRGDPTTALSTLNQNLENGNKSSLAISCTNFFNFLYDEYRDAGVLQFNSTFLENPKPLREFVLVNQLGFNFKRTIFKKDGIKLRIYYTELGD